MTRTVHWLKLRRRPVSMGKEKRAAEEEGLAAKKQKKWILSKKALLA